MSKLILWGSTALDLYRHSSTPPPHTPWLDLTSQESVTPHAAAIRYLEEQFPWLTRPYHVLPRASRRFAIFEGLAAGRQEKSCEHRAMTW